MSNHKRKPLGTQYGAWTVIGRRWDGRRVMCAVVCRCGHRREVRRDNLVDGRSTNCGCIKISDERTRERLAEQAIPEPNTGCLLWLGQVNKFGYGIMKHQDRPRGVHRINYEMSVGPIPKGYEIDHLCCVRSCLNPRHLEPVHPDVNMMRAWQRKVARLGLS